MNAQIATAVEQQGAVSEDINRSIINIRDAADTNVQTGQNNLQSAKSVAQLTSALSELAKQFWEKTRITLFSISTGITYFTIGYPFSRTNFSHGFSGSRGYQNGLRKPSQRAVTRTPLA